MKIERPQSSELASYQQHYVDQVPGDAMELLHGQLNAYAEFIFNAEDRMGYTYEQGKWTIRQVIMHVVDAEQVFGYRAMCISRGEPGTLPGFDQDVYMNATDYTHLDSVAVINAFNAQRIATIRLLENMNESQMMMDGQISDYRNTVRALAYVIAGHAQHHLNILKERYT